MLSIRSPMALRLLRRFHPSNSVSSTKYSTSSKYNRKGPEAHPVISVNEHGSRSWATYLVPAGMMGFVGLAAFVHYNDESRAVLKGLGNALGCSVKGPVIGGLFSILDTERRNFIEKNLCGNWTLLHFVYSSSSPVVVPEQLQIISKAIDILVFVTIDPKVVYPSHLRAYLKEFDPRIRGLSGPVVAVRQMVLFFRVYFKKIEEEGNDCLMDSLHKMYMLSQNLEILMCFGIECNAEELSQAILNVVQKTPQ